MSLHVNDAEAGLRVFELGICVRESRRRRGYVWVSAGTGDVDGFRGYLFRRRGRPLRD